MTPLRTGPQRLANGVAPRPASRRIPGNCEGGSSPLARNAAADPVRTRTERPAGAGASAREV